MTETSQAALANTKMHQAKRSRDGAGKRDAEFQAPVFMRTSSRLQSFISLYAPANDSFSNMCVCIASLSILHISVLVVYFFARPARSPRSGESDSSAAWSFARDLVVVPTCWACVQSRIVPSLHVFSLKLWF